MLGRQGMTRSAAAILLAAVLVAAAITLALVLVPPRPAPAGLSYRPVAFADLPGWAHDDAAAALGAFVRGCDGIDGRPPEATLGPGPVGRVGDWLPLCRQAGRLHAAGADADAVRRFFERHFTPHALRLGRRRDGFLTGYYEPLLEGSRSQTERFDIPLYRRPPELVTVDLGQFRADLAGRRVAGRVEGGQLKPMPDRAAIDAGALEGRGLALVWVDDPVEAFFLHSQGSGRVRLRDGSILRVGYAGPNGHVYRSIGRLLIDRGAMTADAMSAPALKQWLRDHPAQADALMAQNPSYIFFRALSGPDPGPMGALGVALTPGRSLAVDRTRIPLGVPVYLDGHYPDPETQKPRPLQRLTMAQDVGGAIRGALRGDLFWGHGDRAGKIAGHMQHAARFYVLIPKQVAKTARETT